MDERRERAVLLWSRKVGLRKRITSPVLFSKWLPLCLLGMLFIAALAWVFGQADQYGLTVDEPLQDAYGRLVLSWYHTRGQDTRFLTAFPADLYMPQHGAIFEVIVAEAEQLFGNPWHTRAIVNGLAGVVGVAAVALCGFELGGWWVALLAALSLWLYPRYFGAVFNNSKDIPFAAAMTLALWAVLLLARNWDMKRKYLIHSVHAGFFIGAAAAIRVTAVLWYPTLALLLVGWWIQAGRAIVKAGQWRALLRKQATAAGIMLAVSLVTMVALWPYLTLNPLSNLYDSIMVMRQYPWNGDVLFGGQIYPAASIPSIYAPAWLVIGSPPALVIFALIGAVVIGMQLMRRRVVGANIGVVALALLVPLGIIVVFHVTLYDALRQVLFLVPPLILLAVYGFTRLFRYLARKQRKLLAAALVLVVLASQAQVVQAMADLHPYEYIYFSPLVGGVPGASLQYDADYWGICTRPAAEWLAQEYQRYTDHASPTVASPIIEQVQPYLPATFRVDASSPDFYISSTRSGQDQQFPSYVVIHKEVIQGYVACVVKARYPPGLSS
jgi:4-amino-4-deoxy-L-arabinose transferase-like glycosyltransferase